MQRFEHRVIAAVFASLAPLLLAVVWLLPSHSAEVRWTVVGIAVVSLAILVAAVRAQIDYPLRTIANLLSALREEDYSIRARRTSRGDGMSGVTRELNLLTDALRQKRFGAIETAAFVRSVLEHIDSAIFAFDERNHLRLVNRAAERLLGKPAEQLTGRSAGELGVEAFLGGEEMRTAEVALPGGHGRFRIRRTTFRQEGVPHVLLSMSDLSRTLREEERQAWQRLLRVLSHELNNSLAPIRSIAGSLRSILRRDPLPDSWSEDAEQGLEIVDLRAAALTRFLQAYSELARLPQPVLRAMDVGATMRRVAGLETQVAVTVEPGQEVTLIADVDQIEQLLINLLRNAAEATVETGGGVTLAWSATADAVEIRVIDEGSGIGGTANLFVPFFTTKAGGVGIGLTLARQIAEAHDGSLTLTNREDFSHGAVATLRLPRR